MELQHGKKYNVTDKVTGHKDIVTLEHVSRKGIATINVGSGWAGIRIDLSPKRVAELEWKLIV